MDKPKVDNKESITIEDDQARFSTWHPQLGGYASVCVVSFETKVSEYKDGPEVGCFDVTNFHDGEFPSEEGHRLHYCMVEQILRFGLTILEKQMETQRGKTSGRPVILHGDPLNELIFRLTAVHTLNEQRKAEWAKRAVDGVDSKTGDV